MFSELMVLLRKARKPQRPCTLNSPNPKAQNAQKGVRDQGLGFRVQGLGFRVRV